VKNDETSLEICPVEEICEKTLEQLSISEARERTTKGPHTSLSLDSRMIVYRHTRFLLRNSFIQENSEQVHSTGLSFVQLDADEAPPASILDNGLSSVEAIGRLRLFGQNAIDVPIPPWPVLLIRECIHPFVIFQVWAVIVWLTESYWSFSLFILCMAILTAVMNFIDVRKNLLEIRRISLFTTLVRVRRDGKEVEINSVGLVPGDIVILHDPAMRLPCDLVLLKGQVTVTEAMLTGEAVVVVKQPLPLKQTEILAADIAAAEMRNTLCGGTQVVELRPTCKNDKVLAVVVRTGFFTVKGRLVLSILHPKAPAFKFMQEGIKFLGILFFCAMIGFVINAKALSDTGANAGKIVQRGCDMITIVVPPALPLALTVGTMFALIALRKRNIYCISPGRVNLAGKINCFVFDKTGTLTTDGLTLSEICPVSQLEQTAVFLPAVSSQEGLPRDLLACVACCQSLTFVSGKLAGDPLEIETFAFSKAIMEEIPDGRTQSSSLILTSNRLTIPLSRITFGGSSSLTATPLQKQATYCDIIRQFEFTPQLQRMGVIARTSDGKGLWSFVKGSPEALKQLCLPSTIPTNFETMLASYTRRGLRVLGCGARFYNLLDPQSALSAEPLLATTANLLEIDTVNAAARRSSEEGLTFFGFIVLENKLKTQTKPTILRLRDEAQLLLHMATGDNAVSAVAIARECGIVEPNKKVYLGDFPQGISSSNVDASLIIWKDVDNEEMSSIMLDPLTLRQKDDGSGKLSSLPYTLAMTGRAFSAFEAASTRSDEMKSLFRRAIINCSVFARMSPENKGSLVEELQSIGLYVGMIGDGANDTLALRAAHVGISLSQVEASVAAPFTYSVTDPSIDAIPSVLLEGRGALATSFSLFQFMALYSTIQFANALLIVFAGSFLSNNMYLYQDLWVVLILSLTLGNTAAATRLTKKRPSGRLFSAQNLIITFGFILLTFLGQGIAFIAVKRQSWYNTPAYPAVMDPEKDKEGTNSATPETTSVFLIASLQFVACASIFSRGQPWKSSPLTNKPFIIWLLVCFISSLVLFLAPSQGLYDALSLQLLPSDFNIVLLVIASFSFASYFLAMFALQYAKENTGFIRYLEESLFRGPPKAHKAIRKWWIDTQKRQQKAESTSIQFTSQIELTRNVNPASLLSSS
jgi:cation-transporting P-type ATPase 13A2